jgi:PAS domain S-box-containing protein
MGKKPVIPYAQLFDAIPIGLYRRTPDGKLLEVNPALVHASGWPTRESLLALDNVKELYADAADLDRLQEAMARDGVVRQFETRLHRYKEPPLWVEINAVAVRDEQGAITCYEGTVTPIVKRKEMEIELRRSEQRLRAIMDALDQVVAIIDHEQRFVAVMGHRLQEMGYVPETVIGKNVYEVFSSEDAKMHSAAWLRALAGERVVYQWATDMTGRFYWFQVSLFPLREPGGEIIGLVATVYDMTHLKQTQERLARALEEKDALLKELHHRVKNNLQIISSLLNLQFERVQDPGLREMVMESQNRIRAMALVHEQLYRSETLMRLDTRVFLDSLVWSLVRSYATAAQEVEAVVEADPTALDLDVAIPIALIINELVSNCLKHAFPAARAGNRLKVTLRRNAEGRRELVVRDNGVGVPPAFDITATQTLGLSLVLNLVHQIGGSVTHSNVGGTTFSVVF